MNGFSTRFPRFAQRPFRRWRKLAFSAFGLVIILAGAFFAVTRYQAAHAAPALAASCGSWTIVSSPSPNTNLNILYGVSAVSANDVWAVGYSDDSSGNISTLIEHWDGSQWSVVSSLNLGPKTNELYSVAAISTNDVWAVGFYSPNRTTSGLIEHWDGTQWSVVSAQKPTKQGFLLNAITAVSATNLWAVGRSFSTGNQTIIEHWSGTAWRIVASPNPNSQDDILEGVTAVSASNVWAVGEQNFTSATLIEHWNGSVWSVVPSPSPNSAINELDAAAVVSANDVWAVGDDGGEHLLIEQWDGSQWNMKQSAKGGSGFLNGAVAVSGHNVWTVGIGSNGSVSGQAIIEQWDGAKWSFVTTPNPGTNGSVLRGIAVIPGTSSLWSVGDYETGGSSSSNTLTEFYQGCM